MKLTRLIVPAALVTGLALFAPLAGAQTMGEYATTTAGVGGGIGTMGTSIGSSVTNSNDDLGGGSSTWSANSVGASFDERAGSASGSGMGADFDSRAGSSSGGLDSGERFPASQLSSDGSDRFSDSSDRFADSDRFPEGGLSGSSDDRFPATALDQNGQGLDSHYSQSSGLDSGYSSSSGLDSSSSSN